MPCHRVRLKISKCKIAQTRNKVSQSMKRFMMAGRLALVKVDQALLEWPGLEAYTAFLNS